MHAALDRISRERAAALTLELAAIPSPTGETLAVSERLAEELRALDLDVEMLREFPRTPVVIGRLRGRPGGKTLILNGHLDTVPVPHPDPYRRDGRVYGRGTADMKGALAAAVETIRALRESGTGLCGDLVVCAHGLHEAPGGVGEDLEAALRSRAITGDAAIVMELGHDALPVVQMGMGIFRAAFRRPEPVTHELATPAGTPNPLLAAAEAGIALEALNARLAAELLEHVGPETVFLGQLHGGDFYNRFANEAHLEGTRRYAPERERDAVVAELHALLQEIAVRRGLTLDFAFQPVRDGCRIAESHPLVEALRAAYTAETGRSLPACGTRLVADASLFARVGGIPCLYHGPKGEGAHGDLEWLPEGELERAARVFLRTAAAYLGADSADSGA